MKKLISMILTFILFFLIFKSFPLEDSRTGQDIVPSTQGIVLSIDLLQDSKKDSEAKTQKIKVKLLSGKEKGEIINLINNISGDSPYDIKLKLGDKIILSQTNENGKTEYGISDFYRFDYFYLLL